MAGLLEKLELNDKQRRIVFSVSIAVISLSFIPLVSGYINPILNWKMGNTGFTFGIIFAIASLYAAYLLSPARRTL